MVLGGASTRTTRVADSGVTGESTLSKENAADAGFHRVRAALGSSLSRCWPLSRDVAEMENEEEGMWERAGFIYSGGSSPRAKKPWYSCCEVAEQWGERYQMVVADNVTMVSLKTLCYMLYHMPRHGRSIGHWRWV